MQIGINDLPCMRWNFPGDQVSFATKVGRENWVVLLDSPDIKRSSDKQTLLIGPGDGQLTVPQVIPLPHKKVPLYRQRMQNIGSQMAKGTDSAHLRAQCYFAELLATLSEEPGLHARRNPAERLRDRLDADDQQRSSLATHARELSYNSDYLRRLFQKHYGMTPQAYRRQVQAERIMTSITTSQDSVEAVARQLGYRNTATMITVFKSYYGLTPGQAIRQYRQRAAL